MISPNDGKNATEAFYNKAVPQNLELTYVFGIGSFCLFMEAAPFRIEHTAAFPPGARGTLLGVMSQYLGSSHV